MQNLNFRCQKGTSSSCSGFFFGTAASLPSRPAAPAKFKPMLKVADDPKEPGWPVLLVRLPTGQVSWHYSDEDAKKYLSHVPRVTNDWDGHNTEEKYNRVEAMQKYYLWVKPEGT